jgi:hypothetical protein
MAHSLPGRGDPGGRLSRRQEISGEGYPHARFTRAAGDPEGQDAGPERQRARPIRLDRTTLRQGHPEASPGSSAADEPAVNGHSRRSADTSLSQPDRALGRLDHVGQQHVIGPTPPGIGATKPATSRTPGSTSPTRPGVGPGDADVEHGRTRLDHVRGDQVGTPAAATTMSAPRTCAARSRVPVWHSVTVAFSLRRVSSSPSGRPTVTPRPTTTTSRPRSRRRSGGAARRCRAGCTAAAPGCRAPAGRGWWGAARRRPWRGR